MIRLALLAIGLAAPAAAQTPAEAAASNLQLAAELCLSNYFDASALVPAFETAGYQVGPSLDPGTFEFSAHGVSGFLVPEEFNNACTVQSTEVPLATATAIAGSLTTRLFGTSVEQGHPENLPTPCPIWSIFAPRRLIALEVTSAGNGGGCDDPATSGVIIR